VATISAGSPMMRIAAKALTSIFSRKLMTCLLQWVVGLRGKGGPLNQV
jgi:hypothetical protein